MGEPYGMAEGGGNFSAALGVSSPASTSAGRRVEYITQLMLGLSGGPANHGHDGWLTYECSVGNGIMVNDSIEVDEATYPILVEERRIREDSMGFGQWNGAPAVQGAYRSLTGDMTLYFCGDGGTFPAKGVLGGKAGRRTAAPGGTAAASRAPAGLLHGVSGRRRRCITALAPAAAMASPEARSPAGAGGREPEMAERRRGTQDVWRGGETCPNGSRPSAGSKRTEQLCAAEPHRTASSKKRKESGPQTGRKTMKRILSC